MGWDNRQGKERAFGDKLRREKGQWNLCKGDLFGANRQGREKGQEEINSIWR